MTKGYCVMITGILLALIPVTIFGQLRVGTSTIEEATALNNAYHIAYQDSSLNDHIVYQTKVNSLYKSYYVLYEHPYTINTEQIYPNGYQAAYPAITYFCPGDSWPGAVVIPFLSGSISTYSPHAHLRPLSPYPNIVQGSELRLAVKIYPPNEQPAWGYFQIPLGTGSPKVGVPSVVAWTKVGAPTDTAIYYWFVLTYIRYAHWRDTIVSVRGDTIAEDTCHLVLKALKIKFSGQYHRTIALSDSFTIKDTLCSGDDAKNPSTALHTIPEYGEITTVPGIWFHTFYEDPGDIWYLLGRHYETNSRTHDSTWTWQWKKILGRQLSDTSYFNPQTYGWGYRLYLTWTSREHYGSYPNWNYEPGVTYRMMKKPSNFNDPYSWDDTTYMETIGGDEVPDSSNYPNGSQGSVTWVEDTSQDKEITYAWSGDTFSLSPNYDNISQDTLHLDLYPTMDTRTIQVSDTPPALDVMNDFLWTRKITFDSFDIICSRVTFYRDQMASAAEMNPGLANKFQISPRVLPYYEVTCGEPTPSVHCLKRDGCQVINGHKVDIGNNELLYHFYIPKTNLYYLIKAVVWSPKPKSQIFDFNGTEVFVSVNPTSSETLYYVLPKNLYRDNYVRLRIIGAGGAYLENLKLYQYDIIKTSGVRSPQGISSSISPKPLTTLSISPSMSKNFFTIHYSLLQMENVELMVYDATGKMVKKLLDKELKAGFYTFNWTAKQLPAGIYFLRLKTKNTALTNKAIILK